MAKKDKIKNDHLQPRPPVVVVLGHVDHGKSSLLEAIKDFKITSKESGGITQHIGAYEVEHQGKKITFIDTPGHEAFSAMRSRGANVADIAILVVAAEEGVKPQTKEAISHIKKTGIPVIIAANKIDKPGANSEKVKRELAQNDILVESMGGQIPLVEVSAKTGKGIDALLEIILLVAEMGELRGDLTKPGEGLIIEAYLDDQRGPTATLLLRDGALKFGDIIGTRSTFGKIKILEDFQGKPLEKALPSMPCIIIGLGGVPGVGEKFKVYPDSESAQKYIDQKENKTGEKEVFFAEADKKILNLIIKADVSGSLEAIEEMIKNLPREKVIPRILKSEAGEINEGDIKLAQSARARIFGFRVKVDPVAQKLAERENVKILSFDVIYSLVQELRHFMEKSLEPEVVRKDSGKIRALAVFWTEGNRQIVGGRVFEGEVKKGIQVEIFRNDELAGRGRLINVQKNKKDVERATRGEECGILYEGTTKVEVGDTLIAYAEERRRGEL